MSINKAEFNVWLKVIELTDLAIPTTDDPTIVHKISRHAADRDTKEPELFYSPITTPDITKVWGDTIILSGGSFTFDLTDLDGGNLPNIDMSGLKVRLIKISTHPNNSAKIVIKTGATNGYELFGGDGVDNGLIVLSASETAMFVFLDSLELVAAGVKEVDCTSADLDAQFDIIIGVGN